MCFFVDCFRFKNCSSRECALEMSCTGLGQTCSCTAPNKNSSKLNLLSCFLGFIEGFPNPLLWNAQSLDTVTLFSSLHFTKQHLCAPTICQLWHTAVTEWWICDCFSFYCYSWDSAMLWPQQGQLSFRHRLADFPIGESVAPRWRASLYKVKKLSHCPMLAGSSWWGENLD